MRKTFKCAHHTVISDGVGRYTLTADKGWLLQRGGGNPVQSVCTTDYSQWKAVRKPATRKRRTSKSKQ